MPLGNKHGVRGVAIAARVVQSSVPLFVIVHGGLPPPPTLPLRPDHVTLPAKSMNNIRFIIAT